MSERLVIHHRDALAAKGEKVSNDSAILLVPRSLRHPYLTRDNRHKLAPQRETRNSWDMPQGREVDWIDIRPKGNVDKETKAKCGYKRSGEGEGCYAGQ